jgi:hypothetical protein
LVKLLIVVIKTGIKMVRSLFKRRITLVERFKYLFIKTPCSDVNNTPPQLDWEWNETVGGVSSNTSSLQGARA